MSAPAETPAAPVEAVKPEETPAPEPAVAAPVEVPTVVEPAPEPIVVRCYLLLFFGRLYSDVSFPFFLQEAAKEEAKTEEPAAEPAAEAPATEAAAETAPAAEETKPVSATLPTSIKLRLTPST